jgi:hypothetical protein
VLDRITVLAAEGAEKSSDVPTIVAWVICLVALIGIVVAYRRWT